MKIAVVGLGKLGAPLAAVFASKGHEVMGIDLNPDYVDAINRGLPPVDEPGLDALIRASAGRLRASTDMAAAAACEATFVIVPTPTDAATGCFTNRFVLAAMESLGAALRGRADYHTVVITSTVMPGSTGGEIRQALERASGRTVGVDLGLCYNPEFIALGSVVRNMLQPDFLLVGESDARAGAVLESIYRSTVDNDAPVRRMNLINAELAKIAVNTYVTTKISYANMLSDICDRLPGADVDVVTSALGLDSRIGHKYLRGATGYGGPCFPRDNVAFSVMARNLGAQPLLAEATDAVNHLQLERMAAKVKACCAEGGTVAVLGLSYKPDTAVIEESHGIKLALALSEAGLRVRCHDPKAGPAARSVLGARAEVVDDAAAAIAQAEAIVVMTPWPEYGALAAEPFRRQGRPVVVIDPWRMVPQAVADVALVTNPGRRPVEPAR